MQLGKWALGVVAEALRGNAKNPADFSAALGIAPAVLDRSLDELVAAGLMSSSGSGADRHLELTDHGRDLHATVAALESWNDRWTNGGSSRLAPALAELPLAPAGASIAITVLGEFSVSIDGRPVGGLAIGSQRLLVFLALQNRTVSRAAAASAMWPDVSPERAAVSLRSALSRLDGLGRDAITTGSSGLALSDAVTVDYVDAQALAHRLLDVRTPLFDSDLTSAAIAMLSAELLPDWFDEWIIEVGEEWRHLRAAGLEALAIRLLDDGRNADAAGVARVAIKIDPLRETAHAILIRVHLADGDQSNAIAAFESYRTTLGLSLGLEPTRNISALLDGIRFGTSGNESVRR